MNQLQSSGSYIESISTTTAGMDYLNPSSSSSNSPIFHHYQFLSSFTDQFNTISAAAASPSISVSDTVPALLFYNIAGMSGIGSSATAAVVDIDQCCTAGFSINSQYI